MTGKAMNFNLTLTLETQNNLQRLIWYLTDMPLSGDVEKFHYIAVT
jgi:hypothetical protein